MNTLFEAGSHKNIFFNDLSSGKMVQANQHIIIDGDEGIILDPGGHKVHTKLFSQMTDVLPINKLKHIFFSHQDPDIIAAANGWLMVTDAEAHLSVLWIRFIPHFGVDELVSDRIKIIPDEGGVIKLGSIEFKIIPAHYLHSAGNFHLYDPVSKILYSGDIGSSFGHTYTVVQDFDAHVKHMEWFHKRYLPTSKAIELWLKEIDGLDIDIIAPQHGAVYPNKEMCKKLTDWFGGLACGVDAMGDAYKVIPA